MKKVILILLAVVLYSCNTQDQFVQVQDKDLYLNKFVTTGQYPKSKKDSVLVVKHFWKEVKTQLAKSPTLDTVIVNGVKFKISQNL